MRSVFSRIIKAGAIVGTLDILCACAYYFIRTKNNPLNILKFVASGFFGKEAASGGSVMILSGLIFHYIIAFAFTAFFFLFYPNLKLLSKNKLITGVAYGFFIWSIMNLVVVPLSKIGNRPFNIVNAVINAVILIVCIGIPLSFMANAFYKKEYRNV
jgi:uncharacterized membrane protein YagU involved in acid resistance